MWEVREDKKQKQKIWALGFYNIYSLRRGQNAKGDWEEMASNLGGKLWE